MQTATKKAKVIYYNKQVTSATQLCNNVLRLTVDARMGDQLKQQYIINMFKSYMLNCNVD